MKTDTGNLLNGSALAKYGLVFFLIGSVGAAFAHQGAAGIVKERMDLMGNIAKDMKVILYSVRGRVPFNPKAVSDAAKSIENNAEKIPKLFPEGTTGHPSEASDRIWKDWNAFVKHADKMEKSASSMAKLASEAKSPRDLAGPFKDLAASCSSCHSKFRIKK